jgi:hypothetical protein
MQPQRLALLEMFGTALKIGVSALENGGGKQKKVRRNNCTPCKAMDNVERAKKRVHDRFR